MTPNRAWAQLQHDIVACTRCPRLRAHCQTVAREKRAAYRDFDYWGRPVPNFGALTARLLVVGLAPGAHGANRTGRSFTGDGGGNFLIRAMHEAGFASQPTSTHARDGLRLIDAAIVNVTRCAPPENKPAREEIVNCEPFLDETLAMMRRLRVVVALGRIAFDRCLRLHASRDWLSPGQKLTFAHGVECTPASGPALIASFHPSQQNTFTGRLTPEMLRRVFDRARAIILSERHNSARGAGVWPGNGAETRARRGAARRDNRPDRRLTD
ncbi:MAG TPA: uracil-DNA glycosylase [Vicinamibacterales bacterium]|nr:uracil-DNA glycosylase [Vicinamibacterales bacterium]